jgi:hypothetical protein
MEEDNKDPKTNLLFGGIFLIFSILLFAIYSFNGSIFYLLFSLFVIMIGISISTRPIKHLRIVKAYDILFGWIFGLFYLVATIGMSIFLLVMSFYLVWALLTISFRGSAWLIDYFQIFNIDWEEVNKPIFYLSTLVTAVSFSYFGDNIVILLDRFFRYVSNNNKDELTKNLALIFNKYIDFRRRCYEISILFYIVSVIERFSSADLIPFSFWMTYKSVALEVLISFVAIDTYIRNYPRKRAHRTL